MHPDRETRRTAAALLIKILAGVGTGQAPFTRLAYCWQVLLGPFYAVVH